MTNATRSSRPDRTSRPTISVRGDAKPFDFRHPSTMSREHIRTLQIVQETMARGLASTLATSLRAVAQVSIAGIDQVPYEEYSAGLPNPSMLTTLSLSPLIGEAILEIPLPLAFATTELMLGGNGSAVQPERAMTDLERALMHNVVQLMLPVIRNGFEPVVALEPTITGQEANPLFVQIASATDMVVLISFETRIEGATDRVRLCIPFSALQPFLDDLSEQARMGSLSADKLAEERSRLHAHLTETEVEAVARFRPLVASSSAILGLGVGDVVLLDHPVAAPLTLEVDGVPLHDVMIGRVHRHLAVRVDGAIEPGRHQRRHRMHAVSSSTALA
jgi:flagellar motor switch protein FliM